MAISTTNVYRIALVHPSLATYRVPVFRALAARPGFDLTVFYGNTPGRAQEGSVSAFKAELAVVKAVPLSRQALFWQQAQWRYAGARGYDVLVLSWNLRFLSLVPALLRAKSARMPTILWGHGYSKHESANRKRLRDWVASLASGLLFYNHRVANDYLAAGWPRQKIFVALNCLDQQPIQEARTAWLARPAALAEFRRLHGLVHGRTILFVSRLAPANRVGLLIEALAKLVVSMPEIKLVIIGAGEPEGSRLRKLADALGLTEHVRFQGPIFSETELAPWFCCSDLFCYPANVGLSLLHAFGYMLPVVTCDDQSIQGPELEALVSGYNGLLYETGSAGSLANTLRKLLTDEPLRRRLSAAAHDTVLTRFTLDNMVNGMASAIEGCVNQVPNSR